MLRLRYTYTGVIGVLIFLMSSGMGWAQSSTQAGAPYADDANTVLLLDFDQDRGDPYENLASSSVGDANPTNAPAILGNRPNDIWEYGTSVYLKGSEKEYLAVPDNDALDITGDWTIEVWVRVEVNSADAAFGNFDILWKPRATGDWWKGNYFSELKDTGGDFQVSSGTSDQSGNLHNIDSCPGTCAGVINGPNNWYHITYIRDASANTHYQIVHDDQMNHLWTKTITPNITPYVTSDSLYIGTNGHGRFNTDLLLNQLRISNTARTYSPILSNVTNLTNPQSASSSYTVTADVEAFPGINSSDESINAVTLNYNTGSGWQQVSMSNTSGDTYSGDIPQQSAGTFVDYYVSATNSAGQKSVFPYDAENGTEPLYMSFTVEAPEVTALSLDFNEGSGDPQDDSDYSNQVRVKGSPSYAGSGKEGSDALVFDGTDDYLKVDGPLADDEFTIDFWLKASNFDDDWEYIVNKPAISPQLWGENTYEIYANSASKLTAGIYNGSSVRVELLNTPLSQGQWYRVIMRVMEAPELAETYGIYFRIHDSNNDLLEADTVGFNDRPTETPYPVRIGKNGGITETPPFFDGTIDRFKYFNYAKDYIDLTKQMTSGEGWRMLSAPADIVSYDDLLGGFWTQGFTNSDSENNGDSNVKVYDNGTDRFVSVSDQNDIVPAGEGFIFYAFSDDNYDGSADGFPKNLNITGLENAPVTVNTTASEFNLLGNPFATTIDSDNLSLGGSNGVNDNWNGTVYVYDPNKSGGADYINWNGSTGDLTDGLIEPYQGFFVEAQASGTAFEFKAEDTTASDGTFYGKERVAQNGVVNLKIADEEVHTNAYLTFTEKGKIGKDSKDAYDLPSFSDTYMTFYSIMNGQQFDITNLPGGLEEKLSVPFGFERFVDGEAIGGSYTLSWPKLENIPASWTLTLTDTETGETVNLREAEEYAFDVEVDEASAKTRENDELKIEIQSAEESEARFVLGIEPDEATAIGEEQNQRPDAVTLSQNYPNPFNPSTQIGFTLPESGEVSLAVYTVSGQKVAELAKGTMKAGTHSVSFNAAHLPSGVYLYKLQAAGQQMVKKMTLLK